MTGTKVVRTHRRRPVRLLAALVIVAPLVAGASASSPVAASNDIKEINLWTPGPLGPITIFGDSVMLGSGLFSPTLPDQLAARGWGPVRYRAGRGYSTGYFNVNHSFRVSSWIDVWRGQGWDAPNVVINLGANDSGFCGTNLGCARAAITHLADRIGSDKQIWWPQITRLFTNDDDVWNLALRQIANERPNFHTWDWPTEMLLGGYASYDGIHLSADGYRRRSDRMAQVITETLGRAARTGPDAPLPAPMSAPSTYVPLAPLRVMDTREDAPGRRPPGSSLAVAFDGLLPEGATAVAVNVTAAGPAAQGYLAATPCGRPVGASTVNFTPGRSRGAMTVTPLGDGDAVCIYAHVETDVVVDLQGAFVPDTSGAGFSPLPTPQRLADTRETGRAGVLVVPTPPGADAVSVNLTAVNSSHYGFLRASPCDGPATEVSNVNFGPGEAVAGGAFVPTSADDTICVTSNRSVDVVVDLTGTFQDAGGLRFVPAPPARVLDTRDGTGGWSPILGTGQTVDVGVAPASAEAVTGTITMVRPYARGFLRGASCGSGAETSSVNALAGTVFANSITTGIADGRLCLTSSRTTHALFDTTGWWVP